MPDDGTLADYEIERQRREQAEVERQARRADGLVLLDPTKWTAPAPPREWLVRDWIPFGRVTGFYGDGGIGKSLAAQQLLTSTALALPWFGLDTSPGRALGVFCEDDDDELQRRQEAINTCLGVEMENLENLRLLSRLGQDNVLMDFAGYERGVLTDFFNSLDAACGAWGPKLLTLDTAADLFGGDENVRRQVRQFVAECLGKLAATHRCTVLLLAHPSAAGLRDGSGTGGSTAWNNTFRSRLYLTRPDAKDADPDARILSLPKINYGRSGGRLDLVWRAGAFCQPDPSWTKPDPAGLPQIDAMFAEMDRAWRAGRPWSAAPQTRRGGRYFPAWCKQHHGVPEKQAAALLSDWQMNGFIVSEEVSTATKLKGLKVLRKLAP